jgi:hypothetical protein
MYPQFIQFETRRREIETDLDDRFGESTARVTVRRRYLAHDHSITRFVSRRAARVL